MQKKVMILFLFILFLFSVGCKKQEETKMPLVELNVEEMVSFMDADYTFILAVVDNNDAQTTSFIDTLKNYQKNVNNPIYYIDTTDMNFIDQEYVNILLDQTIGKVGLYIVEDGVVTSSLNIPNNAVDLKKDIDATFKEYDLNGLYEVRKEYLEKGERFLKEGYISTAYSSLYHALPSQEAKETLENTIFSFLGLWESAIQDGNTCTYVGINVLTSEDKLYYRTYNGKCDTFNEDKIEAVLYEYYIKDSQIYVKKEREKEYKVLFTIDTINKDELIIKNKKMEYKMKKIEG